jgi:hypothetical protein
MLEFIKNVILMLSFFTFSAFAESKANTNLLKWATNTKELKYTIMTIIYFTFSVIMYMGSAVFMVKVGINSPTIMFIIWVFMTAAIIGFYDKTLLTGTNIQIATNISVVVIALLLLGFVIFRSEAAVAETVEGTLDSQTQTIAE